MGLNTSKGNMYDFVTHTWNTVKGACYHDCSYCYMKRWGALKPVRFDESELKTDLGTGNFIFVGSSCDMFAEDIPSEWINKTLRHCKQHSKNKYLFQTKNPQNMRRYDLPNNSAVCTTIETNRTLPEIMSNSPEPVLRACVMQHLDYKRYITIEPIMDFDIKILVPLIEITYPTQVNIGADSGNNNLPEPSKDKILALISELEKFTVVKQKKNLSRLFK